MKRNKNEIIVRDEQQIEEKSAMAENGHAPFSRAEQLEISETTTNQESISAPANDISEGIQINIEEAQCKIIKAAMKLEREGEIVIVKDY